MVRTRILLPVLVAACAALCALWLALRSGTRPTDGSPAPSPADEFPEPVADDSLALASPPESDREAVVIPSGVPESLRARWKELHAVRMAENRTPPVERPDPPPKAWLRAIFLRADHTPVRDARVAVESYGARQASRAQQKVELGPHGDLRLGLQEGWTAVRFVLDDPEHARFDRYFALPEVLAPVDLGVLVLSGGGAIAGRVRGLEDFQGWVASILPRDKALPSFVQRGTTDFAGLESDGRFLLEHVPAGRVELTVLHPLLGAVMERELEVREGGTTTFEFTYEGTDPSRALIASVGIGRVPLPEELWLSDRRGNRIAPSSIEGSVVTFDDLGGRSYTLTLEVEGHPAVVKRDLRPGTRVQIGVPIAEVTLNGKAATLTREGLRQIELAGEDGLVINLQALQKAQQASKDP